MENTRVIEINVSAHTHSTFLDSGEDGSNSEVINPSSFTSRPDHGHEIPHSEFERREMENTRAIEITVSAQSPSTLHETGEDGGNSETSYPSSFSSGPDYENEIQHREFEEIENTRVIEINVSAHTPSTFLNSGEDGSYIETSYPSPVSSGPYHGNETPNSEFERREMGNTRAIEITVSAQSPSILHETGEDGSNSETSYPSSFSSGPDYENEIQHREFEEIENTRVMEINVSAHAPSTFLDSGEDGRYIETSYPSPVSSRPYHGNETPHGEFERREMENTRVIEITVSGQSPMTLLETGEDGSNSEASYPSSFSSGPDYENEIQHREFEEIENTPVIEISVSAHAPSTYQDSGERGSYIGASNPSSFSSEPNIGNETPYGEFEQQEMGNTRNIERSLTSQWPSTFLPCEDGRIEASNLSSFSPGPDRGNETSLSELEQQKMVNDRVIEISVSTQSPSTFQSCEDGRIEASNPSSFSPGPDHGNETPYGEFEQQEMGNTRNIEISVSSQSPSTFLSCEDGRFQASNPSSFSPGPDQGNETPYGEFEQQKMVNDRVIEISVSSQSPSTFQSCEDGRIEASNPSSFSPGPDHGNETPYGEFEQQEMGNTRNIEISVSSQSSSTFLSCEDGRFQASNPSSFSPGPDHGYETSLSELEQQKMVNDRVIEISVSTQSPSTFQSCEDGRIEASNPSSFSPGPDHGNETPYGEFEQQEMGNTRNIEISVSSQSPSTFLSCEDGRFQASNPSSFSPGPDHGYETSLSELEQQKMVNDRVIEISVSTQSPSTFQSCEDGRIEASNPSSFSPGPDHGNETPYGEFEQQEMGNTRNIEISVSSQSSSTFLSCEDGRFQASNPSSFSPGPDHGYETSLSELEQQEMGNTRNIEISVSSQSPSTFLSCEDGRFQASNPSSFSPGPDHGYETSLSELEQQKMVNDRVIEISVSTQSPSTFQSCEDGRIEASNPSSFSPGPDHGNETPYGEFEQQEMGNTRNIEISVTSQSPSTFLSCDDGRIEASNPSSFSPGLDHGNETPLSEFEIYTTLHPSDRTRGGTAVIIRETIKHFELEEYSELYIQVTSFYVKDRNNNLTVTAIYCSPEGGTDETRFTSFFQMLGDRFIAGGDYNAKHSHWELRLITPKDVLY
ncbi:Endonuclease/exonuclease/phosphatase [Cinara cedri]|uniref:Endonuclease/exonuclease/phosphatase n=1 Tax=Cinara cedri TaxID=506608 RepID=A0A5E4N1U2_9HEMI|nr:Endonuclease/exonuclease/phosphatase [Cinara cedri]